MRIPVPPVRPIAFLLAAGAFLGVGIDAGSVALTRLSMPDDVREAGQAAVSAVEGMPTTRQTAVIALDAAAERGRAQGLMFRARHFTLYPDGRVELTASRTAPTLLLDRVTPLRHLTRVTSTATVTALPYS